MSDESEPQPPTLQRLAEKFRSAMHALGKSPEEPDLEKWAVLIHSSMSGRGRSYHTVEHVFQVDGGVDAIGTLAILFHDTVYCEIDGGLPRGLEQYLGDALQVDGDHVELGPFDPKEDTMRALTARIFGFTPGQAVTFQTGLNELASALLAVRSLDSHLSPAELAQVVTCIEATIPFRPQEAEETLATRLTEADGEHGLGLGDEGVAVAVRRAVRVANSDVGNFAYDDAAAFLSHTWEIIPETNPTLRAPAYTLGEYRQAMAKMESFLRNLDAGRVFRTFRGTPSDEALADMLGRAKANLRRGSRYLRQKHLAARFLETLADLSGGDAPVSLFMGDLPSEAVGLRLEHLMAKPTPTAADADPTVFRLLVEGRKKDSGFDLRHSPLAAHFYAEMGDAKSDAVLDAEDGWPLLEALPSALSARIARACAQIASTRSAKLIAIAERLEGPQPASKRIG
ncbi:MAG: hypothetical protein AB8I08_28180 [Sandaracinaceae bacterium]